jgi:predicted alpha-1,6-mannanase (GH76 family)
VRNLLTDNRRVAFFDPETLEESIMSLNVYRAPWRSVEHRQLRCLVSERFPRVLPLQNARLEVVRRQGRVHRIRRVGGCVETDHQDAFVASFLDRAKDSRGVRRRDQDTLHPGADKVFDRRDLSVVVGVKLAKPSEELCTMLLSLSRRRLP